MTDEKVKPKPNVTITDLAKSYQFDDAKFVIKWNGYNVFVPFMNDGSTPAIGAPVFILSKEGETRIAASHEYHAIMNIIED